MESILEMVQTPYILQSQTKVTSLMEIQWSMQLELKMVNYITATDILKQIDTSVKKIMDQLCM